MSLTNLTTKVLGPGSPPVHAIFHFSLKKSVGRVSISKFVGRVSRSESVDRVSSSKSVGHVSSSNPLVV